MAELLLRTRDPTMLFLRIDHETIQLLLLSLKQLSLFLENGSHTMKPLEAFHTNIILMPLATIRFNAMISIAIGHAKTSTFHA